MAVSLTKLVTVTTPETLPVTAPTKPLVEVTGPEKVVEAMVVPLAQGFAAQSVHRQVGRPVCGAAVTLRGLYPGKNKKERPTEVGVAAGQGQAQAWAKPPELVRRDRPWALYIGTWRAAAMSGMRMSMARSSAEVARATASR